MVGVQDPDLPKWLTNAFTYILEFIQDNGWFMLIGGLLVYLVFNKIKSNIHHHQIFNPDRVEKLDMERKRQRLRQQTDWDAKAAELHKLTADKEARDKRRREKNKFVQKKTDDSDQADWMNGGGGGSGRLVSSVQERYKGRRGGGGGG